jgi:hypothetical protein
LTPGNTAVDLGSGSGYFALKLSPAVGPTGRVLAVDIRRLPLTFLWIRTIIKNKPNIDVVLGKVEDSRLPPSGVVAVLMLNTYHELENPIPILNQILTSLLFPAGASSWWIRSERSTTRLRPPLSRICCAGTAFKMSAVKTGSLTRLPARRGG